MRPPLLVGVVLWLGALAPAAAFTPERPLKAMALSASKDSDETVKPKPEFSALLAAAGWKAEQDGGLDSRGGFGADAHLGRAAEQRVARLEGRRHRLR